VLYRYVVDSAVGSWQRDIADVIYQGRNSHLRADSSHAVALGTALLWS
jgi:hypothetical protein